MKIRIFITGGTFDKEYDQIQEKLVFRDSHIQQMLELGKCKVDVSLRTLMMVDSLDMTDADRELIAKNCTNCEEDKIVITHGTGTAEKTAEFLTKEIRDKTIVITGAMSPYVFGSSDGMFNLGCAIAFAQSLPNGVYVAMNGRYFAAGQVSKNTKTGIFEEK